MRSRLAGLCLLLIPVACGGDSPPPADDVPALAAASEPSADTVRITLEEYTIGMPRVLQAGETVFRIVNRGIEDHNLQLKVAGADSATWQTEGNLAPDATATVSLELKGGTYEVLCDFAGHDARGMWLTLIVEGDG